MGDQPAVAIDTSEIGIIEYVLRFARRIGRIVAIIGPYCDHIVAVPVQHIRYIHYDRQVATEMFRQLLAVDKHFALSHDRFEMQEEFLSFQGCIGSEMLAVPRFPLVVDTTTGFGGQVFDAVRQGNDRPVFVVKVFCIGSRCGSFIETPGRVHGKHFTPGMIHSEETGC